MSSCSSRPWLLLVNPWITDVAAFDLWAWPLGLLYRAAHLRQAGCRVRFLDCLDRFHPDLGADSGVSRRFRTGKYFNEPMGFQPEPARAAGRTFKRYGLPVFLFQKQLERFVEEEGCSPAAILLTSRMTYWYHGVGEAASLLHRFFPESPIALGGLYPTLCPEHAAQTPGVDACFSGLGAGALESWLKSRAGLAGVPPMSEHPADWPLPAVDLLWDRAALPLMTSIGCPCRCSYCASTRLYPRFLRRSHESVVQEIRRHVADFGTQDFAFYDDALLMNSDCHLLPLLRGLQEASFRVRFHTPNGLHYHLITPEVAALMRETGFTTIRLSLESVAAEQLRAWKREGNPDAFVRSVESLRRAGYRREDLGIYIMAGMPGQTPESVAATIEVARAAGAMPKLNEYSPIPGTEEWEKTLALTGPDIAEEPLWQNNSLFFLCNPHFSTEAMQELKQYARQQSAALEGYSASGK